ncbi:MAG TPA: MMPL family transporter, partial [Deltaproteobacteria bacterium]|nr:MMPL family transporter [Deltaproteobacteria bacterium]
MKKVVHFCIDRPYLILSLIAVITLIFASQIPRIRMDSRVEVMLRHDYPPVKTFIANKESFAPYADIIVGMLDTTIYNKGSLEKLRKISEEFEKIKGIKEVTCILNAKYIEGGESGLVVSPLATDGTSPATPEEIRAFREKVESWDVYRGSLVTRDGRGAAISLVLEEGVETIHIIPIYFTMVDIIKKYEGPEKFFISGTKVLEALQSHYMIKDLIILPPLVVVVLLISLYLFFRNLSGMLLPLVSVGIACIWTFGLMAIVKVPLTMISTALPVALMAVGVGYGVHIIENVFSEYSLGNTGPGAIKNSITRIVAPVLIAGLTEVASFLSLVSIWVVPLTQFGILSAFGFCVAMMLVLTFIPAVLSVLDIRGRKYRPIHHTSSDIISPILRKLSSISLHRRGWVFAISLAVFVVAVFLGRHVRSDFNLAENFRERSPIRKADMILNEHFGGTSSYHVVIHGTKADDMKDPAVLNEMDRLQDELKGLEGVGKVVSIADFIKRMNQAMHDGDRAFYTIPDSKELVA